MKSHSSSLPTFFSGRVESSKRALEPEELVEVGGVVETAEDLVLDLVGGAEDVRVVLGDVADAEQPVERARELVAVECRRLGQAHRQLAVGAQRRAEQQHVPRAVHRLEREAGYRSSLEATKKMCSA